LLKVHGTIFAIPESDDLESNMNIRIRLLVIPCFVLMLLPASCSDEAQMITPGTMVGKCNASPAPENGMAGKYESGIENEITLNFNELSLVNLSTALKDESVASARNDDFSHRAAKEGHDRIALLFKATAISEGIHADNHRAVLEEAGKTIEPFSPDFSVGTTGQNLKVALENETDEMNVLYPQYISNATVAGNPMLLTSLNYAYRSGLNNTRLYQAALKALAEKHEEQLPDAYYVCPTCGEVVGNKAPRRCGLSLTPGKNFIRISSF